MGGKVFARRGLCTPRFSTDVYHRATQQVIRQLQPFFEAVEAPICAPEKADHGDIDLGAGGFSGHRPTREQIGTALGAVDSCTDENKLWHYAVPWIDDEEDTAPKLHIQVDVNINETVDQMRWELFKENHGDFCAILGSMLRRHYLTVSGDGLYLSLPELIEHQYAKKKSRVLLSSDPSQVLAFFQLDESQYHTEFDTVESMFRYIATCRFYRPRRKNSDNLESASDGTQPPDEANQTTQEQEVYCTSSDRKKSKKRTVFAQWHENFLPEHADDIPAGPDAYLSYDDLKEAVFSFFGEEVRSQYEDVRAAGLEHIGRNHF